MKGFIVIDGPDGVGKTTLANAVVGHLRSNAGRRALYTCEPTKSPLGMRIRGHLAANDLEPMALLDLFLSDRAAHLRDEIEPALQSGVTVICDRYKYATICYQHLHGIPLDVLLRRGVFRAPDLVFLPQLAPEAILQRMVQRGRARDLFETETFIHRACEMFQKVPALFPGETFVRLDAREGIDELKSIIVRAILE